MDNQLKGTTSKEQKIALKALKSFRSMAEQYLSVSEETVSFKIRDSAEYIPIPKNAFAMLQEILTDMSEGKSIAIVTAESELSTQQVAEILKISRPHLIKLLEKGEMPYRMVGSHRRLRLADVSVYETKIKAARERHLQLLAEQAQALDLGY